MNHGLPIYNICSVIGKPLIDWLKSSAVEAFSVKIFYISGGYSKTTVRFPLNVILGVLIKRFLSMV